MEDVHNVEELKNHVKEHLKEHKEHDAENKLIDEILEKISENTEIELPEELVHDEIHRMLDSYDQRLHMQGLSLDQYLSFSNKTIDDLESELEGEAKKNLTYRYMIEEIANKEKIEVTDEEADKEAERLSIMYQMTKEELINAFGGKDFLIYDTKMRKTLDFLKENNK